MTKTKSQKARSRAIRARGQIRTNGNSAHQVTVLGKQRGRKRNRGLLSDIGNMFLPGIGGAIGQLGDNLVGGFLGGRGAPIAYAGQTRSTQAQSSLEHGCEELAIIPIPGGTPAGTILMQALISPTTIGTRLPQFAKLWSNSRFRKLVVKVTSSNPTTNAGNYTLAIDPDPVQTYPSDNNLPGRLLALPTASRANIWASTQVEMKPNNLLMFNKFNIGGASDAELRQFAAGQVLLATTTATPEDQDNNLSVTVEWDVEFQRPDTQFDAVGGGGSEYTMNLDKRNFNVGVATDIVTVVGLGAIQPPLPLGVEFDFIGLQPYATFINTATSAAVYTSLTAVENIGGNLVFRAAYAGWASNSEWRATNPIPAIFKFSGPQSVTLAPVGFAKVSPALLQVKPTLRASLLDWHRAANLRSKLAKMQASQQRAADEFDFKRMLKSLESIQALSTDGDAEDIPPSLQSPTAEAIG
jgi:hypothetical protein